jgi:putative NADH-flavin reductase
MKLIVFGATGNCGRHFVKLAAAHGHSVTAVVRDGSRADASATVTVVQGNVLDPSFVASTLRGQDAVMSGLGMRYRHPWSARESPDDFISRATTHIVDGMHAAGVARISAISAAGIGDSRPVLNLLVRFLVATSNVGVAYADLERVEQILRASGLNWQAVRPTTLTHKSATGRARQTSRYPATATIPREDVAAFMLQELERPQFAARTPMITVT